MFVYGLSHNAAQQSPPSIPVGVFPSAGASVSGGAVAAGVFDEDHVGLFEEEVFEDGVLHRPLDQSGSLLFSFRRAKPEAKLSASCRARVTLEASKAFINRLV